MNVKLKVSYEQPAELEDVVTRLADSIATVKTTHTLEGRHIAYIRLKPLQDKPKHGIMEQ